MFRKMMMVAIASTAAMVASPSLGATKNWTLPAHKIYAQTLADATMRAHPELLSVTFHGTPPGMHDVYTMFAGSYPDRIGNPDDPDDIDVIKKGITIVDPRWHRTQDPANKFVVQMPLRTRTGENVGLVVYAFKVPFESNAGERKFYNEALNLRDALAKQIPSYEALYRPAR